MSVKLENVSMTVDSEKYIQDISLEFSEGSFNVLLGLPRAGKTTLMRLMAGLECPTHGRVLVDGRDVTGLGIRKRNVAMVYQEFINYPSMTCYQNIASPLKLASFTKAEIDQRVRAVAERLHIEHLLDRLPSELSGGQQQRTALARALAKDAPLLFLDEPLVNLDYKLREELREEMSQMFGGGGRTIVVYATTDPQEVLMLGGNVAVLDKGCLLQYGPVIDVYHRPATMTVSQIFSDPPINLMPAHISADGCRLPTGVAFPRPPHMRALPPGDYWLGARANQIGLAGSDGGRVTIFPVTVSLAEIDGSETFVHARHGDLALIARATGVHRYQVGESIQFALDPNQLLVFDATGALVAMPKPRSGKSRAV